MPVSTRRRRSRRRRSPRSSPGRDILGIAQTGTGKTAAFALPILHQLLELPSRPAPKTCRALVLAPTRELAVQIEAAFRSFAGGARLTTLLVLGGMSRTAQVRAMARGVDVVIATPGRLTDLMDDRSIVLDQTRFVVLDEADRMLDMGFIQPVRRIVAALHPRRQSALFSATMPPEVAELAQGFLKDPVRVEVTPQATAVERIDQRVELVETVGEARPPRRTRRCPRGRPRHRLRPHQARRRPGRRRTSARTASPAEVIHGNKAQNARQRALNLFRNGQVRVLVATDIVARGIDVPGVTHIINYDLPDEPEAYVHRIGRTGRNGADGIAVTLCAPDELKKLRAVGRRLTGTTLPAGHERPAGAVRSAAKRSRPAQAAPAPARTTCPAPGARGTVRPAAPAPRRLQHVRHRTESPGAPSLEPRRPPRSASRVSHSSSASASATWRATSASEALAKRAGSREKSSGSASSTSSLPISAVSRSISPGSASSRCAWVKLSRGARAATAGFAAAGFALARGTRRRRHVLAAALRAIVGPAAGIDRPRGRRPPWRWWWSRPGR